MDILDLLHIERPFTADWDLPATTCGIRQEIVGNQRRVTIGKLRSRPIAIPPRPTGWFAVFLGLLTR